MRPIPQLASLLVYFESDKATYAEAIPVLYHSHRFDFGPQVAGIPPFLESLSEKARSNVSAIHMELVLPTTSRQPPDGTPRGPMIMPGHNRDCIEGHRAPKDNSQDWAKACEYISLGLRLRYLSFNWSESDTPCTDFANALWAKHLVQIQGLREMPTISQSKHPLASRAYIAGSLIPRFCAFLPIATCSDGVLGKPSCRCFLPHLWAVMVDRSSDVDWDTMQDRTHAIVTQITSMNMVL